MTPEEQRTAVLEALREVRKDQERERTMTIIRGFAMIIGVPALFVVGWILLRVLTGG
jgi:hypothetical protein